MTDWNLRSSRLWRLLKKLVVSPAFRLRERTLRRGSIPLYWIDMKNWGDALNPFLVQVLSGKPVHLAHPAHCDCYLAVGSILDNADSRTIVWGSGFIHSEQEVSAPPKRICAVRGPLTRNKLMRSGIPCPETYGDPALVLPSFYTPSVARTHKIGIVPHYIDKDDQWVAAQRYNTDVKIIDIEASFADFIREILSCEVVLSSTLHGLICADSYGIPSLWISLSDAIVGGDFKFRDYYLSLGSDIQTPVSIKCDSDPLALAQAAARKEIGIDIRRLLLSCPFLDSKLRAHIEAMSPEECRAPNSLGNHLASAPIFQAVVAC